MSHVAVVDDEPSICEFLELLLTRAGHQVHLASNVAQFRAVLAEKVDLVISDMRIGAQSGLEVLSLAKAHPTTPEVILITAYGTPSAAVEAMRRGAYDYICKPFDNDELMLLVQKALEKRGLVQENAQLKATLSPKAGPFFIGNSQAMCAVYALVDKVAVASKSTVLITGESGTGKEVVARAIHVRSARGRHPFVPVNCGALNEGVLESELFGHSKGAFTGASSERQGILVSAGEGTVLLDEVGEMPPALQVKLLRVLQERKVKPVGASNEIPFEARILAATNRRLDKEVAAGRFREDLYFRLNVITIELPALRERREDIVPLAHHFLSRVAEDLGRPRLRFADETLALLERYSFSGNVRQLQNLVERAATLADSDILGPDSLPPALRGENVVDASVDQPLAAGFSLEKVLDSTERKYLVEAMKSANNVKMRAAELLGLSFRSFRYRLAKHGLSERDVE